MTNASEFIRFHKLLMKNAPEGYNPFYFRCDKEGKNPYTRIGSWLKNPLTPEETVGWLKEGGNVGIAGLNEDPLVLIDIDDETITDFKTLIPTLTTRSGSRKGVHLYYFESIIGSIPNIPTDDAGEIRANNQYVIAPGSYVAGYEDKVENIGEYTIEVAAPATQIDFCDIPQVFADQLERNKKNREKAGERKAKKTGVKKSAFFDLSVHDIIGSVPNPQERFSSIFHSSKTGANTSISSKGLIQCWRHMVSLNAQQALCVLSGKLTCQEAGTEHARGGAGPSLYTDNDEALFAAWKYAKEKGYIPKDDPIPGRALRYIAITKEICKEEDIEDGWKLPIEAYNNVLEYLNKEGISSGLETIEHTVAKEESEGKLHDTEYYINFRKKTDGKKEFLGIKDKLFADDLTDVYHFKTIRDTEEVLYYEDGYYHYEGEAIIRAESEQMFGKYIKTRNVTEILNHIRRSTYIKRDEINTNKSVLPLQNGLFDLNTHTINGFNPDVLITYKLPVEYNPDANCPNIKKFIEEILNPDDIPIIQEYFGYTLLPSFPAHKSLWMYGIGRNGKSQLVSLLSKMLGDENTVSVPIEEFDGWHRFSTARLFGKLLNVTSEPGVEKPLKSGLFKKVIGGDRISAEIKGKQRTIDFVNFSKFVVLGNIFPQVTDPSLAFWDRLIVVEFPNSFVDTFIPDISEKLIKEDGGLSGFFNWCLEGLKRLEENGFKFTTTKNTEEMKIEFEKLSNPVMAFIKEECVVSVDKKIAKGELYNAYKDYCGDGNYKITGKAEFSKQIGELRGVDGKKARYEGEVTWCWIGMGLENNVDITTEDVDIAQSHITSGKNIIRDCNGETGNTNVSPVAKVDTKGKSMIPSMVNSGR